jgi:hypothetical protein
MFLLILERRLLQRVPLHGRLRRPTLSLTAASGNLFQLYELFLVPALFVRKNSEVLDMSARSSALRKCKFTPLSGTV